MSASVAFTAVGNGPQLLLFKGESVDYAITGTFVGTWVLEYTPNGGMTWTQIATGTGTGSGTYKNDAADAVNIVIRFRCSAYTSGTMTCALTDVADTLYEFKNQKEETVMAIKDDTVQVLGLQVPDGSLEVRDDVDPSKIFKFQVKESHSPGTTLIYQMPNTSQDLLGATNTKAVSNKSFAATPFTAGDEAGAMALALGQDTTSGCQFKVIDETLDLTALGAKFLALTTAIPSGAVIVGAQAMILENVVAGGTTVKVALGLNGSDPDKYGISADLVADTPINLLVDWAVLSGAEQIDLCGVVTDGSALGDTNISAGSVRVRIYYIQLADLPTAS